MLTREYLDETHVVYQDDALYRFTSDAVLLSHFATVKAGDEVGDFCAGCGIVGLNLYLLHPEIARVTLFELQSELCALAERSIEENGFSNAFAVYNARVQDIAPSYAGRFSLVVANPPYCERGRGSQSESESVSLARWEIAITLPELVAAAATALKFGGRFALVHRADRLVDIFAALRCNGLEPKRVKFIGKKEAYLVLVEAVKGGGKGLSVLTENNE